MVRYSQNEPQKPAGSLVGFRRLQELAQESALLGVAAVGEDLLLGGARGGERGLVGGALGVGLGQRGVGRGQLVLERLLLGRRLGGQRGLRE